MLEPNNETYEIDTKQQLQSTENGNENNDNLNAKIIVKKPNEVNEIVSKQQIQSVVGNGISGNPNLLQNHNKNKTIDVEIYEQAKNNSELNCAGNKKQNKTISANKVDQQVIFNLT